MSPTLMRERPAALRARKQDFVRGAIWDAAVDLFAETGFEETTIEQIARAAGVSTRTFFRYFASKNDLMGQGMVTYRALLSDAIRSAPPAFSPLQVVRHAVQEVAAEAASHPRTRQIMHIASTSRAAREAQLSRRAEVEDAATEAFALTCRAAPSDEVTPRLLAGLTLSLVDVTFRAWSTRGETNIVAITEQVFGILTALVSHQPRATRRKRPARGRRPARSESR